MHSANISMTTLKDLSHQRAGDSKNLGFSNVFFPRSKKVWISDLCFVKRGFVRCKFFDTARFQKRRKAVAIVTYVVL